MQGTDESGKVRKTRWVPHSFYMNFCTHSYTMPWWQWESWEKELDWMALHGITMPLIAIGREVVFRKLLLEHGMTGEMLRSFYLTAILCVPSLQA